MVPRIVHDVVGRRINLIRCIVQKLHIFAFVRNILAIMFHSHT